MPIQPYLSFEGRAEEAIEFYRSALGAEVTMLMHFKQAPEGQCAAGTEDKVMHSSLKVGDSGFMVSDGHCTGKPVFQGINLSLTVPNAAAAEKAYAALSQGGQVQMPMTKTFFSPAFGMVADKFGVTWMVMAEG